MDNNLKELIKSNANEVDSFIFSILKGEVTELWKASGHYIHAGGKRIRPFFVITCYEIFHSDLTNEEKKQTILPVAAAIELIHTFTLIHDDIMDHDSIRSNVPTVHTKWGEPKAILAGDLLYSLAFSCLGMSILDGTIRAKISKELGQVGVDLCEGQFLDLDFESRFDVSINEYLEMIRLKTGALLAVSALIGGIAADCNVKELDTLRQFGENFGLAFQIVDDLLGLQGEEKTFGKPIGSDLREGKRTFLVLYAIQNLKSADREDLIQFLKKSTRDDNDIQKMTALIKKCGAIKEANQLVEKYTKIAIDALENLPAGDSVSNLRNLAKYSVSRLF